MNPYRVIKQRLPQDIPYLHKAKEADLIKRGDFIWGFLTHEKETFFLDKPLEDLTRMGLVDSFTDLIEVMEHLQGRGMVQITERLSAAGFHLECRLVR